LSFFLTELASWTTHKFKRKLFHIWHLTSSGLSPITFSANCY